MNIIVNYAWCFSHGALHRFKPRQTPWCTADWIMLDAYSEEVAIGIKQQAWGDARFLHELDPDQQLTIIGLAEQRRARHDGPSVAELADNDRRWDVEKAGE